jgi:eukaryotic-like serine/threonine-protein kinase
VELAKKAVERLPREGNYWNTLGVAHYRAGDYRAAIEALEKAEALEPDKHFAFNAFFVAMANWQLGQRDQARQWYHRAAAWTKSRQGNCRAIPPERRAAPLPR